MFKNLFGGLGKSNTAPKEEAQSVDKGESKRDDFANLPHTLGFVTHQPVHDLQQRVVAYEFMVRDAAKRRESPAGHWLQFDKLMTTTLVNMDVFRLLSTRKAMVHISTVSLDDKALLDFPADSVYLVLNPAIDDPVTEDTLAKIDALRGSGTRFALEPAQFDRRVLPVQLQDELLSRMELLILDFNSTADKVLAPFMDQMLARYPAARWYARNINSAEDFDVCIKTPGAAKRFALFQGPYLVAFRETPGSKADASQMRVMEIMRLLRAGAETKEIDAQFKLDSLLLFKLLRFINSPVNGLSRKVMSIEESLMLLGRESLFKWLTLLLFTSRKDDGRSVGLLERSLFRARFMESLGKLGGNNKLECEHLFLTGMFSLLDSLMQIEMHKALAPMELPPPVTDALQNQRGMFAPYLALAISAEQDNADRVTSLADVLKLELGEVNRAHIDAMVWAQQMMSQSEA